MKNAGKVLATFISAVIISASIIPSIAVSAGQAEPIAFSDLEAGAWYETAVNYLSANQIVNGVGDNLFAPNQGIKRADYLIMLMKACEIQPDEVLYDNYYDGGSTYYTFYLGTARRLGIATGYNDFFRPNDIITRQDMAVLLYRTLEYQSKLDSGMTGSYMDGFSDKAEISAYAVTAMNYLVGTQTLNGHNGYLRPTALATRAEAAQLIYNCCHKIN